MFVPPETSSDEAPSPARELRAIDRNVLRLAGVVRVVVWVSSVVGFFLDQAIGITGAEWFQTKTLAVIGLTWACEQAFRSLRESLLSSKKSDNDFALPAAIGFAVAAAFSLIFGGALEAVAFHGEKLWALFS